MAKALPLYAVNPQASLRSNAPLMLHTRLEELYQFAPLYQRPRPKWTNCTICGSPPSACATRWKSSQPCFPGKDFTKLYDQVKSVQEQIGEIHDRDVRGPLLQAFLDAHAGDRPEIRVGLERLIQTQQSERAKLYRAVYRLLEQTAKAGLQAQFPANAGSVRSRADRSRAGEESVPNP